VYFQIQGPNSFENFVVQMDKIVILKLRNHTNPSVSREATTVQYVYVGYTNVVT